MSLMLLLNATCVDAFLTAEFWVHVTCMLLKSWEHNRQTQMNVGLSPFQKWWTTFVLFLHHNIMFRNDKQKRKEINFHWFRHYKTFSSSRKQKSQKWSHFILLCYWLQTFIPLMTFYPKKWSLILKCCAPLCQNYTFFILDGIPTSQQY